MPYFDPRGSGADREGYVQRGSKGEGNGTFIHRVISTNESFTYSFCRRCMLTYYFSVWGEKYTLIFDF